MDYPGKVITKNQVTPTQTSATGVWTLDDAAAATRNNNWPVAGVPNPISKSLRFNSADSAYLNRTPASASNRKTWTWSAWVKRSVLSTQTNLFYAGGGSTTDYTLINFPSNDTFQITQNTSSVNTILYRTAAVFRDTSAWYHLMVSVDTTQSTAADRAKIYINGVQQTIGSSTTATLNQDTFVNNTTGHTIGVYDSVYANCYLTEVNFIDGQALTPSSFGMTDPVTGVWEPLKYSGTYGTNGFYLNFKDATSTTTLGYDYSGNANNWTTNNFSVTAGAGNDSMTDVPTPWIPYNTTGDVGGVVRGNYCTWNPIDRSGASPTNGNLEIVNDSGTKRVTIPFPSSGKWYWEQLAGSNTNVGICDVTSPVSTFPFYSTTYAKAYYNNGTLYTGGGGATGSWGATYTSGDVISGMFDATVSPPTISFYKNGVLQNSAVTLNSGVVYAIAAGIGGVGVETLNCGQRPFAYTPPSGSLSLCTTNLPASTVLKGSDYFTAYLYTADNTSPKSRTGIGFAPDFLWFKSRSTTFSHALYDQVRGTNKGLQTNTTAAENTYTLLSTFGSDGFTTTTDGTVGNILNDSTNTYVTWCWKANGAGVSNTAGTITSTVSANTTSGFSIVTYTGNGSSSQTFGHGLGVAPSMVIIKSRNNADNWRVFHSSVSGGNTLTLNTTAAAAAPGFWPSNPSSTVVFIGTDSSVNSNTWTYVAYCFAPISGFSAFGSYTGNGSADGPFVYLGFRPRYIMQKRTDSTGTWELYDTARDTYNVMSADLAANLSDAESSVVRFDFLSNGFKIRTTGAATNASGGTYIYAAFAENPFKNALAR